MGGFFVRRSGIHGMIQQKIRGYMEVIRNPYQGAVIRFPGSLNVIAQGGRRQIQSFRQLFLCHTMQI